MLRAIFRSVVSAANSIANTGSRTSATVPAKPPAVVRSVSSRQEKLNRMNPTQKGAVGEITVIEFLRNAGWRHLHTKSGKNDRGIDAVLEKDGQVLLIESKLGSSPLAKGQMSAKWIEDSLASAAKSKKKKIRTTVEVVSQAISAGRIQSQLWRHRVSDGTASIQALDENGKPKKDKKPKVVKTGKHLDRAIARVLRNVRSG